MAVFIQETKPAQAVHGDFWLRGSDGHLEVKAEDIVPNRWFQLLPITSISGLLDNNATIGTTGPAAVPLIVKGAAVQTADLQEWQNSAGGILGRITNDGALYVSTGPVGVTTKPRVFIGTGDDGGTQTLPGLMLGDPAAGPDADSQYIKLFRTFNGHWMISHSGFLFIRGLIDHTGANGINSPVLIGGGPLSVSWAYSDDLDRLVVYTGEVNNSVNKALVLRGQGKVVTLGLSALGGFAGGIEVGTAATDLDPAAGVTHIMEFGTTGNVGLGIDTFPAQLSERLVLPNANYLAWVKAAGGAIAATKVLGLTAGDKVDLDPTGLGVLITGDTTLSRGVVGEVFLKVKNTTTNAGAFSAVRIERNAANTGYARLIFAEAGSDIFEIGIRDADGTLSFRSTAGVLFMSLVPGANRVIFGTPVQGLTMDSALLFTDNSFDIGASGATRPRDLFLSRDIYTNDATFFLRTKATLTNGAAAQVATLTNAPVAGNPTKWIAIDDNGTTRQIPSW